MVLAAFLISTAGVLFALALIQGAQRAAREKARANLEGELASFLDGATARDAEHGSGTYEGLPIEIALGHHEITFDVQLDPAIIPYRELLERHGRGDLARRLVELGLTVDANDRVRGSVPREPGLGENLVTIANRLPVVAQVRALRRFAPGELLTRIDRTHSAAEIDRILIDLGRHFPNAPETQDAIELAAEREHGHPDRVRQRAERWVARG